MTIAETILVEAQQALHEKRFSHAIATSLSLLGDNNLVTDSIRVLKEIPNCLLRLPPKATINQIVPRREFAQNIKNNKDTLQQNPCEWVLALEILHSLSALNADNSLVIESLKEPSNQFKTSIEFQILESIISSSNQSDACQKLELLLHENSRTICESYTSHNHTLTYLIALSKFNAMDAQNEIEKSLTVYLKTSSCFQNEEIDKLVFLLLKVADKPSEEVLNIVNEHSKSHYNDTVSTLTKSYSDWHRGYSKQVLTSLDNLEKDIALTNDFYQYHYGQLRSAVFHRLNMPKEADKAMHASKTHSSNSLFESLLCRLPKN